MDDFGRHSLWAREPFAWRGAWRCTVLALTLTPLGLRREMLLDSQWRAIWRWIGFVCWRLYVVGGGVKTREWLVKTRKKILT